MNPKVCKLWTTTRKMSKNRIRLSWYVGQACYLRQVFTTKQVVFPIYTQRILNGGSVFAPVITNDLKPHWYKYPSITQRIASLLKTEKESQEAEINHMQKFKDKL